MDAMRNVASMAKSSDFKRTVRELKNKVLPPRTAATARPHADARALPRTQVYNYSEIEQMVREVTVSRANALPPAALRGRV